jgi:YVTN family beta-propeller protein
MNPSLRVFSVLFGAIALCAGCTAARLQTRPALESQGAVYLYLNPLSPEASRLFFTLESAAAVTESGDEILLSLNIKELAVRSVSRERLLASGELPPGRYRGFLFKVEKASLTGEEDNASLQSPEEPATADAPFVVTRKKANVFSLTFQYADSLRAGVIFTPRFSVVPPVQPPTGITGYVVDRGANTITVFDKVTGRVTGVIPTGAIPGGMVIDSVAQSRAYLAVSGEDAVDVIDLFLGEVIDRIRLFGGDRPIEVALTPDGKTLLVVNSGSDTVSLFNAVSLNELARLRVGNDPRSIVLDATGRRGYVFNTQGNTISVIDVPNRLVAATIPTETGPLRGQLNRKGDRLYVIHKWSPYLLVIDPFSLAVVRRQHIGMGFQALKVDSTTDWLYMARKGGDEVEIFDPFTLVAGNSFRTGGEVVHMTIDGQERTLLLAMPGSRTVRVINLIRSGVQAEIDVEDNPYWVTVMGER